MTHHWGYLNATLAAGLFGISTTLNKIVLKDLHPLVVAGLIYLSAGLLLYLSRYFLSRKILLERFKIPLNDKKFNKSDWIYLIAIALSGGVLAPFLFLYGLNISTAVNASLLLNAELIFTALIALLFLQERPSAKEYFAIALLFVSAFVITTNLDFSGLDFKSKLIGNLFILGGTLFWAIDNSLSKKLTSGNDLIKVASIKSLIGGFILLSTAFMVGIRFNLQVNLIPYILFVGFFSIGISLVLFLSALRLIGSIRTISIFSMASLFGAISAFVVLKESLTLLHLFSGSTMFYAIYLMSEK